MTQSWCICAERFTKVLPIGKDLFLQRIIDNCNKKGMHEVVYYSNAYPPVQNISELIYQLGKLKFQTPVTPQ